MTRTITQINRDWKIKVFGIHNGKKINTLVGVSGLINVIGEDFADKFLDTAYKSGQDSFHARLRRGIKVSFYNY